MRSVEKIQFQLHEQKVLNTIAWSWQGTVLLLAILDLTLNYLDLAHLGPLQRLTNISRDDGLVNWFSSTQLLCVGVVNWLIVAALQVRAEQVSRTVRRGWAGVALFFTYLAIDDGTRFHETIGSVVSALFKSNTPGKAGLISQWVSAFPSFHWQLVFVPVMGSLGLLILAFLWRHFDSQRQKWAFLGGLMLYGVSVVLDFLQGQEKLYEALARTLGTGSFDVIHFSILFEECAEMFGNTLFMMAFVLQLFAQSRHWSLTLQPESETPAVVRGDA